MSLHPLGTILSGHIRFSGTAASAVGTLYVNDVSSGVAVTITGSGSVLGYSAPTTGRANTDRLYVSIAATVNSVSETQVGRTVVLDATIASRLAPTTAGRTLFVAASGYTNANVSLLNGSVAPVEGLSLLGDRITFDQQGVDDLNALFGLPAQLASHEAQAAIDAGVIGGYFADTITAIGNVPGLVWTNGTRTLSNFGSLVADIWGAMLRTITGSNKDAAIDAAVAASELAVEKADEMLEQLDEVDSELMDINAGLAALGEGGGSVGVGTGDIPVNSDTGGANNLAWQLAGGAGVDGALVTAYLESEHAVGTRAIRGQTFTGTDGRMVNDLMLNAGAYRITFSRDGYRSESTVVTVTAPE